ncbi:hypothetical protein D9601_02390 [Sphingomonas sp. MA1305]|uniref:hypothetical protein n=1 Tax=Sphingomonas sp. MA1305 TaxID=2479204 RepID=UPI0018DF4009|nr:hypothetical protein [Sphingomonas sp. MA1305]MBI0474214.1 hypothetical protein [Sphingomonas sp. MA1305]
MTGQEVTDPNLIAQLEAQSQVRGDDYLKTLDPARASQVKALAEGRMDLPKGNALRSPVGASLLADVAQYDPTFDVANAPARSATRKAFTSGQQSKNITSFNMAIGHLGTLAQRAEELHNWGGVPLLNSTINSIGNAALNASGDPRVSNFNTAKTAVIAELERAFKGAAGTVYDSRQWEGAINSAQSPEQLRGAIGQAAELLQSRIKALKDSYDKGMGTTDQPLPMLSPHAMEALAALQAPEYKSKGYEAVAGLLGSGSGGDGGDSPPEAGTPPTAPGSPPPAGPTSPTGPAPLAADQLQISDGTSKAVDQSATQPIREEVARMVAGGKSANDIRAYLQQSGVNPTAISGLDELVAWRAKNPNYKGGYDISIGPQNVALSGGEKLAATIAGSAPGAAIIGAANTALAGTLPKITAGTDAVLGRLTGDNRDIGTIYDAALKGANYKVDAARDAHPIASLAGDTAGFLAGDAAIGMAGKAISRAVPVLGRLASKASAAEPIARDATFGALTGLGSSDNLSDVPGNVAKGAALAGVGGVLGRGLIKGGAAIASPVVGGAVRRLTDAGVTLTPGQVLGGMGGLAGKIGKGIEDRLAGFPVVGDVVNSTRRAGVEDFNRAAINDVLAPIGQKLPDDIAAGHGAIAHAQETVSKAIENALQPIHAQLDQQITSDIGAVGKKVANMGGNALAEFKGIIANDIQPFWPKNGVMTGEQLQSIKRGLDKEIASRTAAGASPADRNLGERLSEMRDAVMDFASRADPAQAADFAKANEAYSLLSRVEGAAAKSKDGVFTPNQFRQAVTKRGYGTTTKNVARGSARMQELATDAATVLPSSVPDSGTAGREAVGRAIGLIGPGAAIGGAAGYHEGGSTGSALTGAFIGAGLLSKPGARAAQWALAGSRGKSLNTLGDLLRRNARVGGAAAAPLLLSNLSNNGN